MRLTKVLGLAFVAAVAAMAFLGASTASAQEHQIALCKSLVTLCGANELWKAGAVILALAEGAKLETSIGNIVCQDSVVEATLATTLGNPLTSSSASVAFGVLPKPELGNGCTGVCVGGNPNSVHVTLEKLEVIVAPVDNYSLRGTGLALILNCPLVGTCVYRGVDLVSPIKHDGKHSSHTGTNLPLAEFAETLNRQTSHGGSIFCPATSKWTANYVLTLVKEGATSGLGWPSLDK